MATPQTFPVATDAQQILEADDLRNDLVVVPEWKRSIWIRNLWGYERDALEQAATSGQVPNVSGALARIVAWGAMSGPGHDARQLFSQSQVEALNRKNAGPIMRLANAIKRLSAITDADLEAMLATLPNDQDASGGSDTPRRSTAQEESSSESSAATDSPS